MIESKEFIPEAMQPAPNDPKLWDDHLLMICKTSLELIIEEQKYKSEVEYFDFEIFDICELEEIKRMMANQPKMFIKLLSPTPELWKQFSRPRYIGHFRIEFSKLINERLHYI